MSIPIPIIKDNAEERARRVRLLRIWTDICAQVLCDMPDGKSRNAVALDINHDSHMDTLFTVRVYVDGLIKMNEIVFSSRPDAEEKLADIHRRLKPYLA